MKNYSRRHKRYVWVYDNVSTRQWYAKPFPELGKAIAGPFADYVYLMDYLAQEENTDDTDKTR